MDAVGEGNVRLAQLGYVGGDAWIEEVDSPARLRLSGRLLRETIDDAEAMLELLRALPPKRELLAYRILLRIPDY